MDITKQLLILTDGIHPPLNAPRMRNLYNNLCKYNLNWKPYMLTKSLGNNNIDNAFLNPENIFQINYQPSKNFVIWLFHFIVNLCFQNDAKKMYRQAKKLFDENNFDLILCSTAINYPLQAAIKLAKKTKKPLIADMRDIREQSANPEFLLHSFNLWGINKIINKFYFQHTINQRNKLLSNVNYITSVSEWHINFLQKFNANVSLIYNGFDPNLFIPKNIKTDKFIITYTGRFASTAENSLPILFLAIMQLIDNKLIDTNSLQLQFFLTEKDKTYLNNFVKNSEIQSLTKIFDIVTNFQIPDILNNSSILLVFSAAYTKGVMTTKFYEYLGVEKPVLCVMSDEGELEKVIRETNAGIAAQNLQEIKDFIVEQYNLWKQQGYTQMPVNQKIKKQFSRTEQAKQFVEIFDKLITI